MDKVVARKLQPYEGRTLQAMKRQLCNTVNSRHAQVILLSREGFCNREIAERLGYTQVWVRQIIHRFNKGGPEAVTWYPAYCGRGKRGRFLAAVVEQIAEVALSPPKQLIGMSVWSLPKLRDYLVEQRIVESISIERLRQILRQCRIRWRHSKTWKESTDPEFQRKLRRIRRLYARKPDDGIRLCVDEFGPLNVLPRKGKHYGETGHVDRVRATYKRTQGVRYFWGVYDLKRDTLRGGFTSEKNGETFLMFLRSLRRRYRGTLHIVLDNVAYHLKPEVLAYTRAHRIKLYLTPTNASWLNRIESHFTAMRKFCLDNTDYRSHQEQEAAICNYLTWRNRERDISLEDWRAHQRPQRKAA
jgi:transposase